MKKEEVERLVLYLVESFEDEAGASEQIYECTCEFVKLAFGLDASSHFSRSVETMKDGRVRIKSGTNMDKLANTLRKCQLMEKAAESLQFWRDLLKEVSKDIEE